MTTDFWLIKLAENAEFHYDSYDSFVIEAESEAVARALAVAAGGDYAERFADPARSTCVPLRLSGKARFVIGSFNAG